MTVGAGWAWPRSAANCRKNTMSLAHFVMVLYSVSHGLRDIPFSLAEYAKKGAVLIPTQRM
jgi:hypothetical protein